MINVTTVEKIDGCYYTCDSGIILHSLTESYLISGHPNKEWWFCEGKQHRVNGPAIISMYGTEYWFVHGRNITEEVVQWLSENPEVPHWKEWIDAEIVFSR